MNINFAMWRKASWQLIKMDDKKEWDSLDVVSKWLIATRSAVTLVTVYSCVIAGLLAWRDGNFSWIPFLILTFGLFIAHGANNLLNDYTDYSRGVDKNNYFRTQYGVHPLVQGFFSKSQQITWFVVSGVLAALAGVYALFYTGFDPIVIGLFAFGAVTLLAYTYPFKYWGLGELAIFLIWGPILIGGVYLTVPRAEIVFQAHTRVESYNTFDKFYSCKMDENRSVSEHVFRMSGYYNHLNQEGVGLPIGW
jgi:1,4-dihydroxy-2-naphthoate octaprenyltransferase